MDCLWPDQLGSKIGLVQPSKGQGSEKYISDDHSTAHPSSSLDIRKMCAEGGHESSRNADRCKMMWETGVIALLNYATSYTSQCGCAMRYSNFYATVAAWRGYGMTVGSKEGEKGLDLSTQTSISDQNAQNKPEQHKLHNDINIRVITNTTDCILFQIWMLQHTKQHDCEGKRKRRWQYARQQTTMTPHKTTRLRQSHTKQQDCDDTLQQGKKNNRNQVGRQYRCRISTICAEHIYNGNNWSQRNFGTPPFIKGPNRKLGKIYITELKARMLRC